MKPTDFPAFFQAIHGYAPFPWQSRLAAMLCEENEWPAVLDLPTGSGKTSCLDIALFHWLVSASRGAPQAAARRIAFVVDRRIIVDEASERAHAIAAAIQGAQGGVLGIARDTLVAHAPPLRGKEEPLVSVFTLRGGVARERNLVRDPLTVSMVLSTVDQIGSRLLFRGYGVSDGMAPLHAGLFGTDTLLLLDEAHIAEPFRQTLAGIVREQARSAARLNVRPLRWAQLSATPGAAVEGARSFTLDDEDRAHPVLGKRLSARKPMRLLEVGKREDLVKQLVELVEAELASPPLTEDERPRIGLVVNRVQTARSVHEALRKVLKDGAEVELCIGRTRPLQRDAHMSRLSPLLKSSSSPRAGDRPIVVVATQTIEVGADFDFHSMFIEAADHAAVKQRVGRLNRLGLRATSRGAVVLVRSGADDDPLYGHTIVPSWELLLAHATDGAVDLGIGFAPDPTAATRPTPRSTPFLSPPLLGLLVQTSPRPAVEPEVSELLHGFAQQVPDVSVVWRDGVVDAQGQVDEELARQVLEALPPVSTEAMSLPFGTFRQWVQTWTSDKKIKIEDGGDLEGDAPLDFDAQRERIPSKVLVVRGRELRAMRADDVRPGMLVVLPSTVGGADLYGFRAEETARVEDLSLLARQGREAVLVWTPEIAATWLAASVAAVPADGGQGIVGLARVLKEPDLRKRDWMDALFDWFDSWGDHLPEVVQQTFQRIARRRSRARVDAVRRGDEIVGLILREGRATGDDIVEGAGLQRTVKVELSDHLRTVGELAERFARGAGLPADLVTALRVAGAAHDLGKADPRFQRRLKAHPGQLLAKSDEYDETIQRGERHEVYSVAVLDAHPRLLAQAGEHSDLVRYLVGSHHGYGRGLHPVTEDGGTLFDAPFAGEMVHFDGRPAMCSLGSAWSDLFVGMNRRYGPWGLAFLEAVLRLADHRRSELEVYEAVNKEAP